MKIIPRSDTKNVFVDSGFIWFFLVDQFGHITEYMGTIKGKTVSYFPDYVHGLCVDDREHNQHKDTRAAFHIITVEYGVDVDGTEDECLCLGISEKENCTVDDVRERMFIRSFED